MTDPQRSVESEAGGESPDGVESRPGGATSRPDGAESRPGAAKSRPGTVAGLVLAAGAGRRLGGRPKALLADARGEPLLRRTVRDLHDAGCHPRVVVLGAAPEAAGLVEEVDVVVAADWADGMGASLRRGLERLQALDGSSPLAAVLVTLVDLPDVDGAVMARVLDRWREGGARSDALVRACFGGRPGHPVLIGRDHWTPLREVLQGDRGAQPYLDARKVLEVECNDLATGHDLDRPEDLTTWAAR